MKFQNINQFNLLYFIKFQLICYLITRKKSFACYRCYKYLKIIFVNKTLYFHKQFNYIYYKYKYLWADPQKQYQLVTCREILILK